MKSCVKAIKFCSTESRGELQDFACNKLKELEDELIDKLKSAIKEVIVCFYLSLLFLIVALLTKCIKLTSFKFAGWRG